MNIDVDTRKIEENIKRTNDLIKKYEENLNQLFYEIKSIDSFWYGVDKEKIINIMNKEELNCEELIIKLKEINNFFSYSAKKYENWILDINSKFK